MIDFARSRYLGGAPPNTNVGARRSHATIAAAPVGANRRRLRLSRGGPPPNTTFGAPAPTIRTPRSRLGANSRGGIGVPA